MGVGTPQPGFPSERGCKYRDPAESVYAKWGSGGEHRNWPLIGTSFVSTKQRGATQPGAVQPPPIPAEPQSALEPSKRPLAENNAKRRRSRFMARMVESACRSTSPRHGPDRAPERQVAIRDVLRGVGSDSASKRVDQPGEGGRRPDGCCGISPRHSLCRSVAGSAGLREQQRF